MGKLARQVQLVDKGNNQVTDDKVKVNVDKDDVVAK